MPNILLVEPEYRSKFPPLGLMKISQYHKSIGDSVTFIRGCKSQVRTMSWNKIYVSTLFTYELPKTVKTIQYYSHTVDDPKNDIIVGGIAATLLPDYLKQRVSCKVIVGQLDRDNIMGENIPAISKMMPDYEMIHSVDYKYGPSNSYFCRATVGCIRHCRFCAVPKLEPKFSIFRDVKEQIDEVADRYGEKKDLVLLDNNVLASKNLEMIMNQIIEAGFERGSKFQGKLRKVDFNQGIDARLITEDKAKLLSKIALDPIRLAFDHESIKDDYMKAISILSKHGFSRFTNYLMYNYDDNPESLFRRMRLNIDLSERFNVNISAFPMKYAPIDDVQRRYISDKWTWRHIRGIQCVLHATHGVVSPHKEFLNRAFGKDFQEFEEILSMPDDYIINRDQFENSKAKEWRNEFRSLSQKEKQDLFSLLSRIHFSQHRRQIISKNKRYNIFLRHHYPTYFNKNR